MEFQADSLVSDFMSITAAGAEDARRLLQASDNNLEQAVGLYFSSGMSADNASSGVGNPADNQFQHLPDSAPSFPSYPVDEDHVRAPDRVTRQTLVAPVGPSIVPHSSLFNSHRTVNAPFAGIARSGADPHDKKLAKIFKPPYKLMYTGTLDEAKQHCTQDKKWLVVNIQDDTDFSCLVLNRDVWSDDFIEAVVQCSFVLLQWSVDSPSGRQYVQMYEPGKALEFPYIAIIDPQTGALVRRITGHLTAEKLAEKFSDFLEKNPTSFTAAGSMPHSGVDKQAVVSLVDSLGPSSSGAAKNSSFPVDIKAEARPSATTENVGSKRTLKAAADSTEISGLRVVDFKGCAINTAESDGASKAQKFKVSFKLPDNKRIAQEFRHDTTIYDIFAHVVNEKLPSDAAGSVDLIVGFPPKSVLSSVDKDEMNSSSDMIRALLQSIPAESIMSGQLVTVKWTE